MKFFYDYPHYIDTNQLPRNSKLPTLHVSPQTPYFIQVFFAQTKLKQRIPNKAQTKNSMK